MRAILAVILWGFGSCRSSGSCRECHPALDSLLTIGDTTGNGALGSTPVVSPRFRGGYYLVTMPWGPAEELVRVFDSTGHYIRILGHHGAGPNEYRRPEYVHRLGDSAIIHDDVLGRLTSLVPPDSVGITRSWSWRPYTFLSLPDGTFILTTGVWAPGRPIRHIDPGGRELSSFGDSITAKQLGFQAALLASDSKDGFWSVAPTGNLRLQHWQAPGQLIATLDLSRSWYPPYLKYLGPTPNQAPSPRLTGFWTDAKGALWVVAQVADSNWSSGLGPAKQSEGQTYFPIEKPDLVFDTIIEQVDSQTGASLSQVRLDRSLLQVVEPWVLATSTQTEDGWYRVTLWGVRQR